jgi:hypothetical protein
MPERDKRVRGVAWPETGTTATRSRYDHVGPRGNLNTQMSAQRTPIADQRTDSNSPMSSWPGTAGLPATPASL